MSALPSVELLSHFFRFDEHGRVFRKYAKHGWKIVSKLRTSTGYYGVTFQGKTIPAHRIIWALHHGRHPDGVIDHVNGQRWDNRIENLREATHAQNSWNRALPAGKTGVSGVSAVRGGFMAKVTANYRHYRSPVFADLELAELALNVMREKFHGNFVRRSA